MTDRAVVVVTGGGGGIGAALAERIAATGAHVVTVDPLVSVDGAEQLPAPEETTAGRIVAAGGSAEASPTSVTDGPALRTLFERLVHDHGHLDAVVNVAGITRPTGFAKGSEDDWAGVLSVHLDGWREVLGAALPLMAAQGHGRVLGVTSGSGWRAADAGAYSCAKRAVAALTWELGRQVPAGVVVNAISPIAVTRMVTAALGRAAQAAPAAASGGTAATGGLSLGSMPEPEALGPLGARLVAHDVPWSGVVLFAGGPEVAVVERPRLLELVRTDGARSLPHLLAEVVPTAFAKAEQRQASGGGSNPRFGAAYREPGSALPAPAVATCAIASDRSDVAAAVAAALSARGVACTTVGSPADLPPAIDAVVVAPAGGPAPGGSGWERTLAEHGDAAERIHADARWARAVADLAVAEDRPVRLLTVTEATTAGGRSRAQAAAQLARAAQGATGGRVSVLAVSDEGAPAELVAALAAQLVAQEDAASLSGAELAAGPGWVGLRSHPRPTGSIVLGDPELPTWFDAAVDDALGHAGRAR